MTDQQIANQITRQFDEFAAITSDDLLKSMFDRVKDKKGLIEAILITRLNESSAQEIADKIMKNNPSSVEIIDQLKQHFKAGTKVTADDILGSVLDNAQDKRQALETILNSKFILSVHKQIVNLISILKEIVQHLQLKNR